MTTWATKGEFPIWKDVVALLGLAGTIYLLAWLLMLAG